MSTSDIRHKIGSIRIRHDNLSDCVNRIDCHHRPDGQRANPELGKPHQTADPFFFDEALPLENLAPDLIIPEHGQESGAEAKDNVSHYFNLEAL